MKKTNKQEKKQTILLVFIVLILSMITVFVVDKLFRRDVQASKSETNTEIVTKEGIKSNEVIESDTNNVETSEKEINKNQVQNKIEENRTTENNTTKNNTTNDTTTKNTTASNTTTNSTTTKNNTAQVEKGVIYLTIDDGPSKDITPKMLDILKEENVKATFFILNYDQASEKIVQREAEEGHSIGIHGYSHEYSKIYVSEEAYMNNLNKLQEKIKNSTGITSKITRFPGGSSNTVSKKYSQGIMSRLVKKVEQNGYKYYDWNVSSGDAGGAKTSEKVYKNVIKGLSKNKANVVLMHDISGNTKTLNALRDIIQYGKQNGYTFKAISYDSNLVCHHGVNN